MENVRTACVVFVDDERKVCSVVRKTLSRAGMDVRCFQQADDCLRHLLAHRCDLLITDVRMAGKDGFDLLAEVRERLPWIPVLVVTAYGDVALAVRALRSGAADFLQKPLDRDTFLRTVSAVLERNIDCVTLLEPALTKTEMRVLYFILNGRNNRQIADALHRSHRTVEVHRRHLMQKLGVTSAVELLRRVAEMRLLQWDLVRREEGARPPEPSNEDLT